MTRVLVAMSGGVDSSVAAALLAAEGHHVVGATMKLWGGPSDSGCCSVGDVDDARRVAQQLGIVHHVFNFSADFDRHVVEPYVEAHRKGLTPNPCVACNRHLKFDRFFERSRQLGFDAMATGHHARIELDDDGRGRLVRGADNAKDQSYVLHMLDQAHLSRVMLPVGEMTKAEVRARAAALGLRTAAKPDSQDVCFISSTGGRRAFLGERMALRPGRVVDIEGAEVGRVGAVELVTVGQRRGLGLTPAGARQYALTVDMAAATVTVGSESDLAVGVLEIVDVGWVDGEPAEGTEVTVQASAHGRPVPAVWEGLGNDATGLAPGPRGRIRLGAPMRRVAAGQSVVLYAGNRVIGGGTAR
ncbi:MAG: tRNA 2-thiouridine(34) synthase MnmA [Actinomycetota bacterium]|nr:tRNA 2-thiouridine(34) synthase MnmA [Actinomycetota bacterium]